MMGNERYIVGNTTRKIYRGKCYTRRKFVTLSIFSQRIGSINPKCPLYVYLPVCRYTCVSVQNVCFDRTHDRTESLQNMCVVPTIQRTQRTGIWCLPDFSPYNGKMTHGIRDVPTDDISSRATFPNWNIWIFYM